MSDDADCKDLDRSRVKNAPRMDGERDDPTDLACSSQRRSFPARVVDNPRLAWLNAFWLSMLDVEISLVRLISVLSECRWQPMTRQRVSIRCWIAFSSSTYANPFCLRDATVKEEEEPEGLRSFTGDGAAKQATALSRNDTSRYLPCWRYQIASRMYCVSRLCMAMNVGCLVPDRRKRSSRRVPIASQDSTFSY